MGLRMKNLNIMGVHCKIRLLWKFRKEPIYRRELPKKGWLGQRGWCFWGGLIPQCTLWYLKPSRTSMVELFWESCKQLNAVNDFPKKAPSQTFGWVPNMSQSILYWLTSILTSIPLEIIKKTIGILMISGGLEVNKLKY